MTRALEHFEAAQEAYDPTKEDSVLPEVNASLMSVITKFLNDNKITATPEDSQEMSELAETLANKRKGARRRQVGNVVHMDPFAE
jgi:hypothetical protein